MSQARVVIITGASQGIGAGLVRGFLARGHRVVANSRSIKPSADSNILSVTGDIAERATAGHVVGAALEHFGRVDTLVNNAGVFIASPSSTMPIPILPRSLRLMSRGSSTCRKPLRVRCWRKARVISST